MVEVLKFGAIGLGLAVLAYTAALLKQELAKDPPRPEARRLIMLFMVFSLAAFVIAAFIEIYERRMVSETTALAAKVKEIARSLDSNLGGKFQASVRGLADGSVEKNNLIYFTKQLCTDVQQLRGVAGDSDSTPQCAESR